MGIFNFLFGKDEMGDDNRDYVAKNCKEGVDPRSVIDDWGDEEGDENQSDRRDGTASNRDSDGVGYNTIEEVEDFYNVNRYTDITINRREDK
jgi:hypothetical protein